MTNPAIVESFKNASPDYSDPPFKDSDWFEVDKRRVGDYVTPLIQLDSGVELAKVFLETLFAGTQFGLLSKYHTTLAYKLGIADALTSKVGHLFCRALDGRKQGLSFSAEKWHLAKKTFFEPHREVPAWTYDEAGTKSSAGERFAVRPSHLARHPMGMSAFSPTEEREILNRPCICQTTLRESERNSKVSQRKAGENGVPTSGSKSTTTSLENGEKLGPSDSNSEKPALLASSKILPRFSRIFGYVDSSFDLPNLFLYLQAADDVPSIQGYVRTPESGEGQRKARS